MLDRLRAGTAGTTPAPETTSLPQTIAESFQRQVEQRPESIAVRHRDRRLSYAQLSSAAKAVASRLVHHGVRPGARVGICLDRTPEAIGAILGTLRAACTYVPLDPDYPRARLEAMATRARLSAIISDRVFEQRTADRFAQALLIPVDPQDMSGQDRSGGLLTEDRQARPADPAYIAFTSGSTSTPKAVVVSHAQALSVYAAWEQAYDLHQIATHVQMASLSFDVFTGDLLRALLSGATLVISPRETSLDPVALYGLLSDVQAECAEFVPAIFMPLARYAAFSGQKLDFMKLIVVGSDKWTGRDYKAAQAVAGPATRVVNSYGVTEATIDSALFVGDGPQLSDDRTVPIGRPYPGVEAYVVSEDLEAVPAGAVGELAVGGVGVSYGYLDDPALTAEKFPPDPFDARPGARLYRTGDAARWTPEQGLELLGRLDRQLSINGVRIEPGEVEAAIAAHGMVQDVEVVAVRAGRDEREHLVAYVTAATATGVDVRSVREYAARQLPRHAVPTIVAIDKLPLNANGKVDRLALQKLGIPRRAPALQSDDGSLADPVTRRIRTIWREVLGSDTIERTDNFFDLGGDSLDAAEVVEGLRAEFGIPMPLWIMVETRTLGELAHRVRSAIRGNAATETVRRSGIAARQSLDPGDIAVTGGTGATGRFVVRALAKRGFSVAVIGREESQDSADRTAAKFVRGDLRDGAQLEAVARQAGAIVHLACTFVNPDLDVAAMEHLLRGWRRGRFVFISSTDVYGDPQEGVVHESDDYGVAMSPYGVGKQACEELLRSANVRHGARSYTILRPAHIWGPHPRFRSQLEWGDLNWLVAPLLENGLVRIPGPTPLDARRFGDGWIDARDLADAVTESLTAPPGQAINAVAGHFCWLDLAENLRTWLRSTSAIELVDPAECRHVTSGRYSSERLNEVLGVFPRRRYEDTLREVLGQPRAAETHALIGSRDVPIEDVQLR